MSLNFEAVSSCDLPGVQHFPLLTSPKGLGGASLFWRRKRPILGLGIFAFHSRPQTGGICPVLDSDALSSQAPTDMYHPGREDDKLFLGRICMSSSSPADSARWGQRQPEQLNCSSPGKASRAPRTDFQMLPRSDSGFRSSFLEDRGPYS